MLKVLNPSLKTPALDEASKHRLTLSHDWPIQITHIDPLDTLFFPILNSRWSHSTCRWKDMCWVCILYTLARTAEFVLRRVSVYLTSSSSVLKCIQCEMKSKQWSNSSLLTLCSSVAFTPCVTRDTWGMIRLRANSKVTSHWRSILHFPWCLSDMFTYEKTMRSRRQAEV